jgi:predicted enzyme related to lactoylglutathione lyase
MRVDYVFAGLAVDDLDNAMAWYERLLGRPADLLPNASEAVWQLAETASLCVVVDPDRAGRGVATLVVDDLDGWLAEARTRGVVPPPIQEIPGAGRKAVVTDPDGNAVSLAEVLATGTV